VAVCVYDTLYKPLEGGSPDRASRSDFVRCSNDGRTLHIKSRDLGGLAKYIDIRVPTKNENIVWLGSCSHMKISLYL
jgi:hypothetical protein